MAVDVTVALRPGESHEVALPGRTTAGYTWMVTVDDPSVVAVAEKPRTPSDTGPPGAPTEQVYVVTAIGGGLAHVRFEQRRAWEPDEPPADARTVCVEVGAA